MGGESEQEEKQREVVGQVQVEMMQTRVEGQQEETTVKKTGENNDGKESSEHMGEEEAEETEGGANTSEVEVGHRRTEQDSATCEVRKRQKAEKKGKGLGRVMRRTIKVTPKLDLPWKKASRNCFEVLRDLEEDGDD